MVKIGQDYSVLLGIARDRLAPETGSDKASDEGVEKRACLRRKSLVARIASDGFGWFPIGFVLVDGKGVDG